MVPRENKNNAYSKLEGGGGEGGANKEYYGIFRNGLLSSSQPLHISFYFWN